MSGTAEAEIHREFESAQSPLERFLDIQFQVPGFLISRNRIRIALSFLFGGFARNNGLFRAITYIMTNRDTTIHKGVGAHADHDHLQKHQTHHNHFLSLQFIQWANLR